MIVARLTPDCKWISLSSDNFKEMEQVRLFFTKKINNWYILIKKHPYMCVDESFLNSYNMIPAGLWMELVKACKKFKYDLQFLDDFEKNVTNPTVTKEGFVDYVNHLFEKSERKPKEYQIEAAYKALLYKNCCIEVSTSGGKTLISYLLFRYMKDVLHYSHILYVTPKTNLTTQSTDKFKQYDEWNGISSDWTFSEIHAKAKKKEQYLENIVFGNFQSLCRKKNEFFEKFDAIINDETHHATCDSIKNIMRKCGAVKYKIGMTGTFPQEGSYDSFTLQSVIGALVYRYTSYSLINEEKFATPVYVSMFRLNYLDTATKKALYEMRVNKDRNDPTAGGKILDAEKEIARNSEKRFKYVCDLISRTTKNTLVIFTDVQNRYGYRIYTYLKENTPKSVYYIDGEVDVSNREEIKDEMENDDGGNTVIVASIGCFSEGIDIANLWNIILVETTKSENSLAQILGRGMRRYPGKDKTMFIDLADDYRYHEKYDEFHGDNYLLKHGDSRAEIYERRGFPFKSFDIQL